MKKIFIVCLLGMGLLLPSTTITAKNSSSARATEKSSKRIIDVAIEGAVLSVTSDPQTGTLSNVKIFNALKQKIYDQPASGYSDAIDVSGLHSGIYTVVVKSALSNSTEFIYIN